ncbi:hypothetical protein BDY19DRAFT_957933 [Irpex rosettiformis]|uniref:Uncharacterized protein n=1 Tax=Irpex rosettiformis TaxID=378272 RepID=A0ACB8TYL0_9APHY|nr:hypothetical protein BDY19DRAFT_957933 [Irpex rosettiformis]
MIIEGLLGTLTIVQAALLNPWGPYALGSKVTLTITPTQSAATKSKQLRPRFLVRTVLEVVSFTTRFPSGLTYFS